MKLNEPFLPARAIPNMDADSPFRFFNVRCLECGSLRLILIAELNYESGEIAVIRRIASGKSCECGSRKFPPRHN